MLYFPESKIPLLRCSKLTKRELNFVVRGPEQKPAVSSTGLLFPACHQPPAPINFQPVCPALGPGDPPPHCENRELCAHLESQHCPGGGGSLGDSVPLKWALYTQDVDGPLMSQTCTHIGVLWDKWSLLPLEKGAGTPTQSGPLCRGNYFDLKATEKRQMWGKALYFLNCLKIE